MRRMLAAAGALAAALAMAACGGGPAALPGAADVQAAPMPVGAKDPADVPTADAADTGCDARASLRPSGELPKPGSMPAGSTMATIAARGRLIAGVDQNSYRFGFRDPASGELTGFDVDVAREVARAIFGDPNKIQFRATNSAARIPSLQDGTVDIVVQTMTVNCARWKQVAFSTEYFTAGQRILVNKASGITDIDGLRGRKVCAAAGSTSIVNLAASPAKPSLVSVPDWTDCLVMLQQNQVAAVSTDDSILAGLAAQDPNTAVVGKRFSDEPYGIGVKLTSTDLVRFINGVLERMRADGTWNRLYDKWLTALGPASPPPAKYRD
ncbi:glutamate ABC transporter substrate-binding protein [Rhizomonospora bruguierae]|uniref:glutamate ABC transporter substrate-binding protein n=1 Tax=Rhizomonospora bruguierae TaxID=1581705 RepID=UPI001BCC1FA4|nr:glutamate ABC transporter substrate-binding protein [Micromonospora sp. NBRC 107566]